MKSTLFALVSLISPLLAIDPIEIVGNKWFNSKTGEEFIIKGVAYQPGGSGKQDPIANTSQLANAIRLFKELGINTIRVYEAYGHLNHDKGMKMLADAGIYVIFDLSNPKTSINREEPKYDTSILNAFTQKADNFAKYDNTLAYFAGNEVNNDLTNTNSNPFVKATIRDMKTHMKAQKRYIPIGYANNDDEKTLQNIVDYFNCGESDERIDFFGYNIYSWCGDSSMEKSSYDKKTDMFKDYGIPVFFSEYGCNKVRPRKFSDIPALYSSPMSDVFSGGLIYEFTEEANNYGLVKSNGNNFVKLEDFNTYKDQLSKLSLKPTKKSSYKAPKSNGSKCPKEGSNWKASNDLPPTPSVDACNCLAKTFSCVVSKSFNVTGENSDAGKLFGYACGDGKVDCTRLAADGTKGRYGDISYCDPTTQLSYAFNALYNKSKKNKEACPDDGKHSTQSPSQSDEKKCLAMTHNLSDKAPETIGNPDTDDTSKDLPEDSSLTDSQKSKSNSGNSGSDGHYLLPSFASLAAATFIASLLI
jgi:hypothetical protein